MIRLYRESDIQQVVEMIADMRVFLARLKSTEKVPNLEAAAIELQSYIDKEFPIFVAESSEGLTGYLVCRIDDGVIWAESLFVSPKFRRQGIASALYSEAECSVKKLGGDTVFNSVYPNNNASILFLKKRGYTVLNLIELRRPWSDERLTTKVQVGENEFDY